MEADNEKEEMRRNKERMIMRGRRKEEGGGRRRKEGNSSSTSSSSCYSSLLFFSIPPPSISSFISILPSPLFTSFPFFIKEMAYNSKRECRVGLPIPLSSIHVLQFCLSVVGLQQLACSLEALMYSTLGHSRGRSD